MKKNAAAKKPVSSTKSGKALGDSPSRRFVALSADLGRRTDDADAFLRPRNGRLTFTRDALAEEMAEGFVGSATSGEDRLESRDMVVDEELGGPFVTTPARREFADGTDPSNPEDAECAPFPQATSQGELPPDADYEG